MGLFDEIGKKIAKSGQETVKKAKDLAGIAKLNGQIAEEQRALTAFYAQIGEKYYELYKDAPQEQFVQFCERITAGLQRIAELQAEVLKLKNTRACPKCGAACPTDVLFCGACGEQLPPIAPADDAAAEASAEPDAEPAAEPGAESAAETEAASEQSAEQPEPQE